MGGSGALDLRNSRSRINLPRCRARRGATLAVILGVGINAVDIARIEQIHEGHGDRMLSKLFTDAELAYLSTKTFPAQHIAVRLAAKEAAYKALSGNDDARAIGWREIEVLTR